MARIPRRRGKKTGGGKPGSIPYDAREIFKAIEKAVEDIVQEDAIAALATIIQATPVGDPRLWQNPNSAPPGYVGGHARASWNVTNGIISDEELPGVDAAGGQTTERGKGVIAKWTLAQSFIAIQNAAPYIDRLNNGHSTQAPAMFVEQAIAASQQQIPSENI